jgi:hypothetical protein
MPDVSEKSHAFNVKRHIQQDRSPAT